MSTQTDNAQTVVQQLDLDIDSLFTGAPGAESVVTPTSAPAQTKPSIFSNKSVDLSFLDPDAKDDEKTDDDKKSDVTGEGDQKPAPTEVTQDELKDILDDVNDAIKDEEKNSGRPRIDKSGLVDTMTKLIEEGLIIPFDDEKSMDEYSLKDWKELLQANFEEREKAVRQETPKQFFESLPEELQYAAKYVADGGQDLKGLFKALAQVEEFREMTTEDPNDQEFIVRSYLRATGFGDDSEIDEEISTWKDLNKLEQQAKKFKPKLDAMQEQVVQQQLAQQEQLRQQQQEAADAYVSNVYDALKSAEVNGLKLDKKTQAQLYTGLVQPQYPSISGRPTNQLGHLLEKYQFVEPNYPLIAEALWLLSDPESYRQNLIKQGKNQAVEQTVRQLKTEQANKIASSVVDETETRTQKKIVRPTNIFKR
jgi:hypothetical protein